MLPLLFQAWGWKRYQEWKRDNGTKKFEKHWSRCSLATHSADTNSNCQCEITIAASMLQHWQHSFLTANQVFSPGWWGLCTQRKPGLSSQSQSNFAWPKLESKTLYGGPRAWNWCSVSTVLVVVQASCISNVMVFSF